MKKKIVILGATIYQYPMIVKAKEMGYETHVFAWETGDIGEKEADVFHPISILEKEKILEECKKIKPEAVITIGSDLANTTVQYLCENLGLTWNDKETVYHSTNKAAMRKVLKDHGISVPKFVKAYKGDDYFSLVEENDLNYPLVIKPTDRSGSRGITKIYSSDELVDKVNYAIDQSIEGACVIEEFIEGEELSSDVISYDGDHHVLTITKKYTTGSPRYIENGHIDPANISQERGEKIASQVKDALDALGIKYGGSHSEFMIDEDDNITIVEIASRLSGDCISAYLVNYSTGYDFLKMAINIAAGKGFKFEPDKNPKPTGVRFILNKEDLDAYHYLKENHPDWIQVVSPFNEEDVGTWYVEDSSKRYGYFIFTADSYDEVKEIIER